MKPDETLTPDKVWELPLWVQRTVLNAMHSEVGEEKDVQNLIDIITMLASELEKVQDLAERRLIRKRLYKERAKRCLLASMRAGIALKKMQDKYGEKGMEDKTMPRVENIDTDKAMKFLSKRSIEASEKYAVKVAEAQAYLNGYKEAIYDVMDIFDNAEYEKGTNGGAKQDG